MVAGCWACLVATGLLRLLLGLHGTGAEASACQPQVLHKKVGDAVELSSCSPAEGIIKASWRYEGKSIADDKINIRGNHFEGRLYFNPTNFSLTLSQLTVRDSGQFQFVSREQQGEGHRKQRATVSVTLQVHELITREPQLSIFISRLSANGSCTVHLWCSHPAQDNITYSWTVGNQLVGNQTVGNQVVGNQVVGGSWLNYTMFYQDEETKFTCTSSNFVSRMSASKLLSCSSQPDVQEKNFIIFWAAASAGSLLVFIVFVLIIVLCVRRCKKKHSGGDPNDMTLYADITEVASAAGTSSKVPNSLYETIDHRAGPVAAGPQTVYDEIQLSRLKTAPLSFYQELP